MSESINVTWEEPSTLQHPARPEEKQTERTEQSNSESCDQCGRRGTRGFTLVGERGAEQDRGITWFVVCKNTNACRKRWGNPLGMDVWE